MIYLTVTTDGLDELARDVLDFERTILDVAPVCQSIRDVMLTQNMAARMAGVDRDGNPFAELSPATWERHPYRGMGPPLAPMDSASRIISGFEVDIVPVSYGAADVIGHWPSMDDFIIYHITGTKYMPQRNPAGLTPTAWAAVGDVFDSWMNSLAGGVHE